jgi:hypothetical protein
MVNGSTTRIIVLCDIHIGAPVVLLPFFRQTMEARGRR